MDSFLQVGRPRARRLHTAAAALIGVLSVVLLSAAGSARAEGGCPCSLFDAGAAPSLVNLPVRDGRPEPGPWTYELGVKIKVDADSQLTAVRFYKDNLETGEHVGRVWSSDGTLLASTTFTGEGASGWQQQALSAPLQLTAGQTYVVSVGLNQSFAMTPGGLAGEIASGLLRSVADGLNGVFAPSAGSFPTQSFGSSNYFVDAVVDLPPPPPPTAAAPPPPPPPPPTLRHRPPRLRRPRLHLRRSPRTRRTSASR